MLAEAQEFVRTSDWVRAIELFNQLLLNATALRPDQIVDCLDRRSECFSFLGQHDAVLADSRRIIDIAGTKGGDDVIVCRARRRLVHSLFSLKRYGDVELAVQEWMHKCGSNCAEEVKLLKLLHKMQSTSGDPNLVEVDLLNFEAKTQAISNCTRMNTNLKQTKVHCTYCNLTFKDKTELQAHCQTEVHQQVIMSDEGRDWFWRAPPRGFNSETYRLCECWTEMGGVCRYGTQCVEAHGADELAEWKQRFEYRRMKLQRACDAELFGKSYTEELIDKLIQTTAPDKVMRENLADVSDSCSSKLSVSVSTKSSQHEWIFVLKSVRQLRAVALLQDIHRTYFKIVQVHLDASDMQLDLEIRNDQEWLLRPELAMPDNMRLYQVRVAFAAGIYGTFRQSVVFDFGAEPVLAKHLCVDVIPVTDIDKVNAIRKEVVLSNAERWTYLNADIVPFTSALTSLVPSYGDTDTNWAKHLASVYPCPDSQSFGLSHATITEKRLTRNNYRSRMHELLYIEEMARYEKIARFNLTTKLKIIHSYLLSPNSTASSTAKYSSGGELFALMHLGKELSEDTSAGRLILNNCTTILLAPEDAQESPSQPVYEALIEDKGKSMIYLRLSSTIVTNLKLVADTEVKFNVQFQLNRIPYCEWHYAIDKIPDFKIIFPETYLEPNIPWTPARQWSDTLDSRLNPKQKEAIVAITTPLYIHLPPILIIGPFGTGKTFTLAQAIKQLMLQPENRVLICTQSNSAADLYIKDYLHPFVESGHKEATPLRIYYHKRWVATVNQIVQKYCMIETSGGGRNFKIPTLEDIMKHRIIVVTLSISMYFSTIELPRGFFTHIFLDEAAQAMECEAIMPLALVDQNTRIVLAGDHMQLSPELFSHFAKERNLHVSLLERLYDHYPSSFPCKILLSENYRAHEAIIQFTSESFYEQKLVSSGKQPSHDYYYPLTFFTTRGEDVQDMNSTAFYNNSEVYEIVERVTELKKHWPTAWGKFDEQSIGILTPYSDQVARVRSELRKRRMYGISVERVLNVQGKQFRAIFLSTVRTRRTCTSKTVDEIDFGFLSNSKLLNTAITRAQSLVAVVGDPVALCSIGRCSKVWERFICICNENKSLFGITWSSLRTQLDGVELKKTYVLNPLAPEFIPRRYQQEALLRRHLLQHQSFPNAYPFIRLPIPFASPPPLIDPKLGLNPTIFPIFNQVPQPAIFPIRPAHLPHPWPTPTPPQYVKESPIIESIHPVININLPVKNHTTPQPPIKPPPTEKNLIQFFNNVHFPEFPKHPQTNCSLNEYINLLPPNMSLADMLLRPFNHQQRWYQHLLETKGIDAAKKFEFLIHATTKKEPSHETPQPATRPASTSYIQQTVPNLNHYNKPIQQLNVNQPVYLEQHKIASSQPLYRRHSASQTEAESERHVRQQQWQQQINADFANMSLHNGESVDEMFKRYNTNSASYASVLRTPTKPTADEARVVNGDSSTAKGPRLYQYF